MRRKPRPHPGFVDKIAPGRRRRPDVPDVPEVHPAAKIGHQPQHVAVPKEDPAEEAVRRMVEAAYT
jgi:hypothetical protein